MPDTRVEISVAENLSRKHYNFKRRLAFKLKRNWVVHCCLGQFNRNSSMSAYLKTTKKLDEYIMTGLLINLLQTGFQKLFEIHDDWFRKRFRGQFQGLFRLKWTILALSRITAVCLVTILHARRTLRFTPHSQSFSSLLDPLVGVDG